MMHGSVCRHWCPCPPAEQEYEVTNYNNVVEGNSDSDDEDKLHIVEEESLPEAAECDSNAPQKALSSCSAVLAQNGADHGQEWEEVKDECGSEGEENGSTDAMMEEMLQQGDTAVIYPEAPEDEERQGTPEASGHDENGTPDTFSQLLTCPYCARGYKRYTSLKEHIKYRHEKSEGNFSCSLCSYTFAYRTQLDRHMAAHKSGREQRVHVTQSGGNRKFKCTECAKAFKYKHHLKEHLRIHSGEKPYECPNCKKRFSHSGSYSSHISSKKCIGPLPPREKPDPGKPLQEQLPLNQIKVEPVEYEYKTAVAAAAPVVNGVFNGGSPAMLQATAAPPHPQGVVQAVVLPTVGLMSPISINLSDLQSVLKVAVDGNVLRQVLESAHLNAATLPIIDQDGTTKIIINYSLEPAPPATAAAQAPKKEVPTRVAETREAEKPPEDLTIKADQKKKAGAEPEAAGETATVVEAVSVAVSAADGGRTCLLCDDCPGGPAADGTADPESGSDNAISALLSDGSPSRPPLKNLLSLLKAYFALNAEPTTQELTKISESVSLPVDVVKKWFGKMQSGQISVGGLPPHSSLPSGEEEVPPICKGDVLDVGEISLILSESPGLSDEPAETNDEGDSIDLPHDPPSPLNLSATGLIIVKSEEDSDEEGQAEPLDLSLPKLPRGEAERDASSVYQTSVYSVQDEPLNLTCTKKEQPPSDTIYVTPSANTINIVTTQLPTILAITDQGSLPCLRAVTASKQTILIPQLAYTYTTSGTSPTGNETQQKPPQANGHQEERMDTSSEGVEEQNDSDSAPPRKKMRKTESGMYACDLCDKIFQKSSSLLRHKYEHTGKRPHECGICSKAFKHKHHLIEHMRLHSGEKPYQCDKCGKRFSHSGSYSQHMNHRYSYCKKEAQEGEGGEGEGARWGPRGA
ncbi:hypothetical protein AAFF_G00021880 [Aldrovandia affinis]|uniref:Zinc finger E-box-binding homeobox 1 n=1 Tax=Aldrovandia affinis TaxID=143900 RepID=A0AAD7S523_9TELE|nr:hypothetical protein AAFF_G00021880 [Aldrovandia affinis]